MIFPTRILEAIQVPNPSDRQISEIHSYLDGVIERSSDCGKMQMLREYAKFAINNESSHLMDIVLSKGVYKMSTSTRTKILRTPGKMADVVWKHLQGENNNQPLDEKEGHGNEDTVLDAVDEVHSAILTENFDKLNSFINAGFRLNIAEVEIAIRGRKPRMLELLLEHVNINSMRRKLISLAHCVHCSECVNILTRFENQEVRRQAKSSRRVLIGSNTVHIIPSDGSYLNCTLRNLVQRNITKSILKAY